MRKNCSLWILHEQLSLIQLQFHSHNIFEQQKNSLARDPRCICSIKFDLALFNNKNVFSLLTCKESLHNQSRTCWWNHKISKDALLLGITLCKHIFMALTLMNSSQAVLLRAKPSLPAVPMSETGWFHCRKPCTGDTYTALMLHRTSLCQNKQSLSGPV